MTPEEFTVKMKNIAVNFNEDDPEVGHYKADSLMCELLKLLGYSEGIAVYDEMTRWYS